MSTTLFPVRWALCVETEPNRFRPTSVLGVSTWQLTPLQQAISPHAKTTFILILLILSKNLISPLSIVELSPVYNEIISILVKSTSLFSLLFWLVELSIYPYVDGDFYMKFCASLFRLYKFFFLIIFICQRIMERLMTMLMVVKAKS